MSTSKLRRCHSLHLVNYVKLISSNQGSFCLISVMFCVYWIQYNIQKCVKVQVLLKDSDNLGARRAKVVVYQSDQGVRTP